MADEFAGRARVVKVELDREGFALEGFEASGVPSYLVFKDGVEVDRLRLTAISWWLEGRLRRMVENALD